MGPLLLPTNFLQRGFINVDLGGHEAVQIKCVHIALFKFIPDQLCTLGNQQFKQ